MSNNNRVSVQEQIERGILQPSNSVRGITGKASETYTGCATCTG